MRKHLNATRKRRRASRKAIKRIRGGQAPLKVAILFTGRIKGYEHVKENLRRIKEKYNPIVFCSLNKKNKTNYVKGFCDFMDITDERLHLETAPNVLGFLNDPRAKVNEQYKQAWGNTDASSRFDNMSSFFYHTKQAMLLVEKYQEEHKMKFDAVLYYRADIDSPEEISIPNPIKENTVYIPKPRDNSNTDYGGICNVLQFGSPAVMKTICSLIDSLEHICIEQGVTFHAESLLKKHIENNAISVERFPYSYALHSARFNRNPEANEV